ncbi:MAG: hypothetical protein JXR91_05975 [Deltaproteobacteria bacterium]|nr:hypothetical protein [Deltaproteobacteria bacterium]
MKAIVIHSLVLAVIILCIPFSGAAQNDNSQQNIEAKHAFNDGRKAFEAENYEAAATAFRKAYELRPNWKVLFNLAQSEAAAKQHGLALQTFEMYVSKGGDDIPSDRMDTVLDELERLRRMVGYVTIFAPDGVEVEVKIDGISRGVTPIRGQIPVAAGVRHKVLLEGTEFTPQEFQVSGQQVVNIKFGGDGQDDSNQNLDESSGGKEKTESSVSTDNPKSSPLAVAGWVTLGTGAAVLIGGTVTGIMALSSNSDLVDSCKDGCPDRADDVDSRDNKAKASTIMFGVGGGLVAVGIVLLIINSKQKESVSTPVAFTPVAGRGFAGGQIAWRF